MRVTNCHLGVATCKGRVLRPTAEHNEQAWVPHHQVVGCHRVHGHAHALLQAPRVQLAHLHRLRRHKRAWPCVMVCTRQHEAAALHKGILHRAAGQHVADVGRRAVALGRPRRVRGAARGGGPEKVGVVGVVAPQAVSQSAHRRRVCGGAVRGHHEERRVPRRLEWRAVGADLRHERRAAEAVAAVLLRQLRREAAVRRGRVLAASAA